MEKCVWKIQIPALWLKLFSPLSWRWEFPVAGGAPHQMTNFASGRILDFAWALDGKTLFLAKGDVTRDVVLISKVH
jgi:hypothetical protein